MRKYLALLAAMVVVGAVMAMSALGAGAPAPKVGVCHINGKGVYKLINVSENAVAAHIAHGDGLPGNLVGNKLLGADCSLIATQTEVSVQLNFSSTGWAGWSCPAGTKVLGAVVQKPGGGTPDSDVASVTLWKDGASAPNTNPVVYHPSTPFSYIYTPPEEGAIVQNGGTPQSLQIVLTCTA